MHPYVNYSIVYSSQNMEATSLSTDKWIKKMWYIYTMEYYSAIKNNEILPFARTLMDLGCIILSGTS